jgi:hypothetical protein
VRNDPFESCFSQATRKCQADFVCVSPPQETLKFFSQNHSHHQKAINSNVIEFTSRQNGMSAGEGLLEISDIGQMLPEISLSEEAFVAICSPE